MTTTYKRGIIGPGKIANKFAMAIRLAGNAELAAVASRNSERAREFANHYGAPRYYDNYEALVEDPEIDAVYVATPHAFHFDQVMLCLAHRKAVLCEKPMALSASQVERMVRSAREHKTFLMEAMWTRFLPLTEKIVEVIRDGRLGSVKYVRADFGFAGAFHPENRLFNLNLGGGALLDIGVYPMLLCLFILGAPDSILASGHLASTGADDSVHACLGYKNGNSAVASATFTSQTSITAEISGTEGCIVIPNAWYKNDHFTLNRVGQEPETFTVEPMVNGFEYEIRELQSCLSQGLIESPRMSHDFSLLLAKSMDEVRRQIGVVYPGE